MLLLLLLSLFFSVVNAFVSGGSRYFVSGRVLCGNLHHNTRNRNLQVLYSDNTQDSNYSYTADYDEEKEYLGTSLTYSLTHLLTYSLTQPLTHSLTHLLDIIQNRTNYYNEVLAKKYEIYKNSFLDNFQDENYDENFINNLGKYVIHSFLLTHLTNSLAHLVNPSEMPQVVARAVEWIIKRIVRLRTLFVSGLRINILSPSNRDLLRGFSFTHSYTCLLTYSRTQQSGKIQILAMKFDKIGYGQLLVTGGGRLLIEGIELRMRRFLLGLGSNNLSLRNPYRIFGDFLLTQR